MATSVDFKVITTGQYTPVRVMAYNEDAYRYLTEDCPVTPVSGGYVEMTVEHAGDFLCDAAAAGMTCTYA